MTESSRAKSRKTSPWRLPDGWWILLVLVGSVLVGAFVLPRISVAGAARRGPAPDFSLPLLNADGTANTSRISLEALRGKVVVLDFWATWCGPCATQAQVLARYAAVPRPNVEVIGINSGESAQAVSRYLAQRPANYAMALDEDGQLGQAYGVQGLPTLVVIDARGNIVSIYSGLVPYAQLERLVRAAL